MFYDYERANLWISVEFLACGGIYTSPEGLISSPLHRERYPHDLTCRWIIRAGPGKKIRLTWLSFALEHGFEHCSYDYVEVFDNTTVPNSGGSLGRSYWIYSFRWNQTRDVNDWNYRYCGRNLPPIMTSMDDTMTIVFKSDNSVSAEGFSVSYATVNDSGKAISPQKHNIRPVQCSLLDTWHLSSM